MHYIEIDENAIYGLEPGDIVCPAWMDDPKPIDEMVIDNIGLTWGHSEAEAFVYWRDGRRRKPPFDECIPVSWLRFLRSKELS